MFRKIYDCINPMVVMPICGVAYGLVRAAGAYVDSVQAGAEMSGPQIAGYTLGAVFVWGLAGLTLAWVFEWFDRREARKQGEASEAEQQG
ncbi:hypothetical protein KUV47_01900 [Vannielia litorea]|uniref:hypothetical protein n=1 Tax=Vannielia TaxID=2813041 RepID=UPI001C98C250|nr:hypothetical protein [Vannielia litorea]MBY6048146.1 hypothetical protein [Vannielia litorea]MBY6075560.1 hypothetical protein [Vannielia litorea]MBY6151951.1 hypothetical protein [Vannielia litorea]